MAPVPPKNMFFLVGNTIYLPSAFIGLITPFPAGYRYFMPCNMT